MSDTDDPKKLLPGRIGAANAVQLANAMHAAFERTKGVDGAIKKAARALWSASDALRVAWEARVRASIMSDGGASARRADTDEDAVWLALHKWLEGWATLPAALAPEADKAAAVLRAVFADGVGFTNLTYAMEWAEAERRLAVIASGGYAATIESLGGASLLQALRRAHGEYERVLGVTRRATMPPDPANDALADMAGDVRAALEAYLDAIAAAGVAHADPATRERAQALVEPLRAWAREYGAP